jgi:hypothetical protein
MESKGVRRKDKGSCPLCLEKDDATHTAEVSREKYMEKRITR